MRPPSPAGWNDVAEIVVAAELVDRGFRFHRLTEDALCRRDELLLGDYCLVCAAELATRLGRSDVEIEFSRAATAAAIGEEYEPALRRAVAVAVNPPRASLSVDGEAAVRAGAIAAEVDRPGEEVNVVDGQLERLLANDPVSVRQPMAGPAGRGWEAPSAAAGLPRLAPGAAPRPRARRDPGLGGGVHPQRHPGPRRRRRREPDAPRPPAVHVAYGPGVAVRVGDFYFGRAAALLAELDNSRTTRLIVEAVSRVCEAQIEEFTYRGMDNLDEAGYLRIVEGKTAALFSGACAAGAALGGAGSEVVDAMVAYGHNLGVAFQMVDDVLDFSPNSGKALVQDLRQSVGLPLVYAAELPAVRLRLTALLDSDDFDADAAVAIMRESGALERAMDRASGYRDRAVTALQTLPDGDVRERLASIADFALARQS